MVGYADKWMAQRRARVDPFQPDPLAACRQPAPPLTPDVAAAAATVVHRHAPSSAQLQLQEAADIEGPTTPAAPAALRKSLSNSPHNSWAGFKGLDLQEQQQQPHTPRVLYPVPTAPGPLHLMALDAAEGGGGGGGGGMSLAGGLRRGHSLEWEPRMQSSSNGSVIVLDEPKQQGDAAVSSSNGEAVQQPQHVWQRVLHASAGASRWGGEVVGGAAGAVRGGVVHVVHAPGAAASWVWGVIRGQQGPPQSAQDVGVQSRGVKQGAVRLLAPAGPEGEDVESADSAAGLALQQTAAAAATAAAAVAVQQQSGGSTTPFRSVGFHAGVPTDFGGSSSRPAARGSLSKRLQRLLLAAGVAALVGAGVAAHSRGKHTHNGGKKQEVMQHTASERGQKGKGLKPGL